LVPTQPTTAPRAAPTSEPATDLEFDQLDLSFPPYLLDDIPTFEKSPDYYMINQELVGSPHEPVPPRDSAFAKLMTLKVDLDSIYLKFILVQQSPNPILSMDDYTMEEWTLVLEKSNQRYLYKKQRQVLFLLRAQINKKVSDFRQLKEIKGKYGTPRFNLLIKFYNEYSKDNEFEPGLFVAKGKLTDNEYILSIDPNGNFFGSEEILVEDLSSGQEELIVRFFWSFESFLFF
jgi:hypothetical protein